MKYSQRGVSGMVLSSQLEDSSLHIFVSFYNMTYSGVQLSCPETPLGAVGFFPHFFHFYELI